MGIPGRLRAFHAPIGDPCQKCNKPASYHVTPQILAKQKEREKHRVRARRESVIIGIDGEGHDLPDGRHIYTLLCAVDETGKVIAEAENQNGLTSLECVQMLLSLPRDGLKFVFMGSYDWTKIIEDLMPEDIYCIMHPDTRRLRICKKCKFRFRTKALLCDRCGSEDIRSVLQLHSVRKDKHGNAMRYGFDWMNGSFSVAEPHEKYPQERKKKSNWKKTIKVWDVFKFFQCSFVKAIEAWGIGTKEQQERILGMKNQRGSFAEVDPYKIKLYCREECWLLAKMMRKLIDACKTANIELARFDGAGAIANALMKREGVKRFIGPALETQHPELQHGVMSAYFGGRFENSIIGFKRKKVYNRDIFSAYPYALRGLPCLECGKWSKTKSRRRVKSATLALVHYRIKKSTKKERQNIPWMPLPFRTKEGSICFPTGSEGYAWFVEYTEAEKGWPEWVEFIDAWVYETECEHKPFEWISKAYRQRCEWGKDGPGIVMKLGTNACAGKTMQNAGDNPPFKSWIWGGVVTATTRSQALRAICKSTNRWNVLAIATDGVFSTEKVELDQPKDTGTFDLEKPLGGWGCDEYPNMFFVKPGMYYSLDKKILRARGIGRDDLDYYLKLLYDEFYKWDRKSSLKIQVNSRRFYGARSSILMYSHCIKCEQSWVGHPLKMCPVCNRIGDSARCTKMNLPDKVTPAYGRWAKRKIDIEFTFEPKREAITKQKHFGRLRILDMDGAASEPYLGITSALGLAARVATEEALEEPDWSDDESNHPN